MRNTVIGILAHVDAGKTTLSESILYHTGAIRHRGRVDHGDAFLDTDEMEKKRGITIYSKLARFQTDNRPFTILDTPGHADFSPEMERALRVMDDAVLVVSAADVIAQNGADPQVRTLWRLLAHYKVPTFVFINKMDQQLHEPSGKPETSEPGVETGTVSDCVRRHADDIFEGESGKIRKKIFDLLSHDLGTGLVPFGEGQLQENNEEAVAVCSDALMEKVLNGGHVSDEDAAELVAERKLFPVYFGSALRDEGTADLIKGLDLYAAVCPAGDSFGAIVYKITREEAVRLTWMKITGGTLSVRDSVREQLPRYTTDDTDDTNSEEGDEEDVPVSSGYMSGHPLGTDNISDIPSNGSSTGTTEEKVSEIRLYSGSRYTRVTSAAAGEIVAIAGLSYTHAGDGLGRESSSREELLTPIQTSRVTATDLYGKPVDDFTLLKALRGLEEEEPMLAAAQEDGTHDITVRIMGPVQIEILKKVLYDQYHLRAEFGPGTIVYKETIRRPVEGVGHFEPLRHYAEVHLLLEPGDPGSGLVFENHCPPNTLDRNWQNLIMTHLQEKTHVGVLTGSAITDMRISLIGGRASRKHTSGGDFRKATYAAVRQGLMMAENILLEPFMAVRLEIPTENIGRAMTDISQMYGTTQPAEFTSDGMAILEGSVPASELGDYAQTVAGYTGGRGRIDVSLKGYEPCHNAREVIDRKGYDPDTDRRNPTWSVFCSHGAGTVVPWDRVRDFMQLDTGWQPSAEDSKGPFLSDDYYTFQAGSTQDFEIDRGEEESEKVSKKNAVHADTRSFKERQNAFFAGEEELRRIFEQTYGPVKRNLRHPDNEKYYSDAHDNDASVTDQKDNGKQTERKGSRSRKGVTPPQEFLLVDGYNIIFAWEELKELASTDIKSARDRLLDILSDYAGYTGLNIIVVFDAYKVPGGQGEVIRFHNIDVVYTKEAETADLYIEKTAHQLSKSHRVTVATGDLVEQVIIFGTGAVRLSPRGLLENILLAAQDMRERFLKD